MGVKRVKRLLEGSLRFKLPYNAYQHPERVRLEMLTGHQETYDLNGDYLDENGQEVTRVYGQSTSHSHQMADRQEPRPSVALGAGQFTALRSRRS